MTTIVTSSTGYVCPVLNGVAPPTTDILSDIDSDLALSQTLTLTPRGPAWGTDEAGDGSGASTVLRGWWRALAGVAADGFRAAFETSMQSQPSAVSWSLDLWENELGLPNPCSGVETSTAARVNAIRRKHQEAGSASPGYFICVAASLGYEISIEEPDAFLCDESECDGPDEVTEIDIGQFWIVNVTGLREDWFLCDEGECDSDPLESYVQATGLECELRRQSPVHTTLVFNYTA